MAETYEISTDPDRFDIDLIHDFLHSSYWARNIPRAIVEKSIRNCLCFGIFSEGRQVGFARAITDRATFAYLADVFVIPSHRGRGIAAKTSHPSTAASVSSPIRWRWAGDRTSAR